MLRRVALVRTDASEELSASFIRVTRIGELGTRHAAKKYQDLVTLMTEAQSSSETSVLTRTTRRNIPEDASLHTHRREKLTSCIVPTKVTDHCQVHESPPLLPVLIQINPAQSLILLL
jgi:hypothetical protein